MLSSLTKTIKDGGIYSFDDVDKKNIAKVKFRNSTTIEQKQIEMIAYLLELVYDLCICMTDNVSVSPGFKPIIGAVV